MKLSITTLLYAASAALLIATACNNAAPTKALADQGSDPLLSHMDSSQQPNEDFFMFANNGWFKANPIPASETSNGIFKTIQDDVNDAIKKICEHAAAATDATPGSNKQKIGDFYASGMDTVAIAQLGFGALAEEIKKVTAITNTNELLAQIAHQQRIGAGGMFGFYVNNDDMNSAKYAIFLSQGGLGLPNRDYYFNTDERAKNIRTQYVAYIAEALTLSGVDKASAATSADMIMKLETSLAKACRKLEALRDPYANYNKKSIVEFSKSTPNINWQVMLANMGIKNPDTVVIGQPEFFTALDKLVKETSLDTWKDYCRWQYLNTFSPYLNKELDQAHFNFYAKTLSGQQEQKPRWKRIVEQTDGSLGELIGQVYVDEHLPKGSKEKLMEIGLNIKAVYAERIKALDWMGDSTKQKALSKLDKIIFKVGYPDKWKDMSSMQITRKNFVQNVINANAWGYDDMVRKFGQPVDRTEWGMYPQTYNAYYNPSNNEICVPGCNIYVPGFELADDAVLYGIIGGSTFGHEITHGFDDQGSQYDENGNLNNWWTAEDKRKFGEKTKLIVQQFNNYTVLDSIHVNGDATQGENIADLGGVVMGYEAFKKTPQYKNNEIIAGLTPDQRFFLGYAYAWMVNRRPEAMQRMILTDVHAPAQWRINGPLSNMPEFYKTFDVKEGDKMYRPDSMRVKIW
ncbi:MAG: Neutral endopeptidase [Bacteroidota bacterium]